MATTDANDLDNLFKTYRIMDYIHWYPAIEQQRMMDAWTAEHKPGTFTSTGLVGADDRTVITVQADVNYGYCWFNIADEPLTIELPAYERYWSLSIFDMHHFIEAVLVAPEKPVVVRLANQVSPLADAHEVVLRTNSGLAFLRMVIPTAEDEAEVLALTEQIRTTGGGGDEAFIIPDFSEAEREAALQIIQAYVAQNTEGDKAFGKSTQGVGDLDRAAGVFQGQLGIPAQYVQYRVYFTTEDGQPLTGGAYAITIDPAGMIRNDKGYWSVTVYNAEDRYLIPNPDGRYSMTSYSAVAGDDGTYTVRINPDGSGENAIPTMGKPIYAVMRVYEPNGKVTFPPMMAA